MVRAPDCGSGGCGFKSRLSPHFVGGEPSGIGSRKDAPVAQLDRATVSGTVGQRFEPSQAYHFLMVVRIEFALLKENGTCADLLYPEIQLG